MFARALVAVSLTALLTSPALALEGKALMEKWIAEARDKGSEISWTMFTERDDDGFAMTGVEVIGDDGSTLRIDAVIADGLRQTDDGRVVYDTFTVSGVEGTTRDDGDFAVSAISTGDGDWPVEAMKDGIDEDDRGKRVRFGNFTVNGIAIRNQGQGVTLDTMTVNDLDWPIRTEAFLQGKAEEPARMGVWDMRNLSGSADGNDFAIGMLSLVGLNIPVGLGETISGLDWLKIYRTFSIEDVTFGMAGKQVFSMDSMRSALVETNSGETFRSDARIDDLKVDFKSLPDPNARQMLGIIGYDELELDVDAVGSYHADEGRIEIDKAQFLFRDMFDLDFDYSISGYTPEVVKELNRVQIEAMEKGNSQVDPAKFIPILSGVKLEDFSLKLTDRSLTGRLLGFQASQMGTTAEQLAAGAPMLLSAGMAGLGMPELTQMVSKAVGDFLQQKGALSVEMNPEAPVSVAEIMTVGQSDPKQIPELLNLQVTGK